MTEPNDPNAPFDIQLRHAADAVLEAIADIVADFPEASEVDIFHTAAHAVLPEYPVAVQKEYAQMHGVVLP